MQLIEKRCKGHIRAFVSENMGQTAGCLNRLAIQLVSKQFIRDWRVSDENANKVN